MDNEQKNIKAIIGLGNPGPRFHGTRHNIGFMILDQLADAFQGTWQMKDEMEIATIRIHEKPVLLIKPQTLLHYL